jgi:hypothetical protein
VSLGHYSVQQDCDTFIDFLKENFLNKSPAVATAPVLAANTEHAAPDTGSLIRSPLLPGGPCTAVLSGDGAKRAAPSATNVDPAGSSGVTLVAIFVYPIKSCAGKPAWVPRLACNLPYCNTGVYSSGMRVEAWPLSSNGLMYDRGWALVDAAGKAITQKAHPRLVLVQPTINLQDGVMVVRAPGMSEDLVVPIANSSTGSAKCSGKSISSAVCAGNVISSHSNSCYN